MRQIGPGMMQQMQVPCDACGGRGKNMRDEDKCMSCYGSCTKTVEQPLTVRIEPGMEHDQQIPFPGEGDQSPDYDVPGAIVVVLGQVKHDTFVRDGDDLQVTRKISVAEALCGTYVTLKHLDDREIAIQVKPEDGIKPGSVKCVKGMGMPVYGKRGSFGDLVVTFEVTFPETLDASAIEALRKVLPPPSNRAPDDFDPEHVEEAVVSRTELDEMRKEMEKEAEDDDDEEGPGTVRCASH